MEKLVCTGHRPTRRSQACTPGLPQRKGHSRCALRPWSPTLPFGTRQREGQCQGASVPGHRHGVSADREQHKEAGSCLMGGEASGSSGCAGCGQQDTQPAGFPHSPAVWPLKEGQHWGEPRLQQWSGMECQGPVSGFEHKLESQRREPLSLQAHPDLLWKTGPPPTHGKVRANEDEAPSQQQRPRTPRASADRADPPCAPLQSAALVLRGAAHTRSSPPARRPALSVRKWSSKTGST